MTSPSRPWNALLVAAAPLIFANCSSGAQGTGTGGMPDSGGVVAMGGTVATGGTSDSGGSSATGGTSGAGGSSGFGGNTIEGDACAITTPTRWAAGVYVAKCTIEVRSTLTIAAGAIVKFVPGTYLNVHPEGTLTAIASDSLPIVFTSLKDDAHGGDSGGDGPTVPARNDWGCQGTCGDLNIQGEGSVLEHVHDLYGSNGVYVQAGSVEINDSTFAHHNTYGMVLDGRFDVETTLLSGNVFFDNGGYPLRMEKTVFLLSNNIFHDPDHPDTKNAKQCIELATDIDQLVMLAVTELGFLFTGQEIAAELLVPSDTIFKMRDSLVSLAPSAIFPNGENMIFTSYKDDSVGGDCTGDGDTVPEVGDWQGLWIDDGTSADYAAPSDYIRYAAKSGTKPLPVL